MAVHPHTTAGDLDVWRTQVRNRDLQVQKDYQTVVDQNSQIAATRKQISDLVSRLQDKTRKLSKYFGTQAVTTALSKSDALDSSITDVSNNATSVTSSTQSGTPPLLAHYYDRKGDIGIFRERLQELEYLYQEELDERDVVVERGDILDVSDEQFNESYRLQRGAVIFDLTQAEYDAQILAQRCRAEGLDISERGRDSSKDEASISIQAPTDAREVQLSGKQQRNPSVSTASSNGLSPRGQIRIRGWLETLSDPGTPAQVAPGSENVNTDGYSPERGLSLDIKAANEAQSPVIVTSSFLRRAASYPQSSRRAVDTATHPSFARIRAPVDSIQLQKEVTDFELVPERTERDTASLPEGEVWADEPIRRPALDRIFSFFRRRLVES